MLRGSRRAVMVAIKYDEIVIMIGESVRLENVYYVYG